LLIYEQRQFSSSSLLVDLTIMSISTHFQGGNKMQNETTQQQTEISEDKVKVLYQNLNGTWYAFAQLGSQVYYGKVPKVERLMGIKLPPVPKEAA